MSKRFALLLVGILALVAVTGCRADATVTIELASDGSGVVRVAVTADAEAVATLADPATAAVVDDLVARRWTVEGPVVGEAGASTWTATKPFADPQGLVDVLAEIGVFGPAEVVIDSDRSGRTIRLATTIDLTRGVETYGDEDLRQATGVSAFGVDVSAYAQRTGIDIPSSLGLTVAVAPPGTVRSNDATENVDGVLVWKPQYLQATPMTLEARDDERGLAVTIAIIAGLVAVVSLVIVLLRGRRSDRWKPSRGGYGGGRGGRPMRPLRY